MVSRGSACSHLRAPLEWPVCRGGHLFCQAVSFMLCAAEGHHEFAWQASLGVSLAACSRRRKDTPQTPAGRWLCGPLGGAIGTTVATRTIRQPDSGVFFAIDSADTAHDGNR